MSVNRRRVLELSGGAAIGSAVAASRILGPLDGTTALGTLAAALMEWIHASRATGSPGESPYFIIDCGPVFVQALARPGQSMLQLEAVSGSIDPQIAAWLSPARRRRLHELGFQTPGARSPNYWQDLEVDRPCDIKMAGARLGKVLTEVFDVAENDRLNVTVVIPGTRPFYLASLSGLGT